MLGRIDSVLAEATVATGGGAASKEPPLVFSSELLFCPQQHYGRRSGSGRFSSPKITHVKHLGEREENVTGTSVAGAIAMVAMARCT